MRRKMQFFVFVIAVAGFASQSPMQARGRENEGAVFVMTNATDRNEIIAYERSSEGYLSDRHTVPTGGRGSGGTTDPLGSQGSLALTGDHAYLLAVNAGSGNISVFRVHGSNLNLVDRAPSGGSEPVSVTQHGNLVYVLNAGGSSNVTGFRLENGNLTPIPDSVTYLTTNNSGPGSVTFSPDGRFLAVVEKITNNIDVFSVKHDGHLNPVVATPGIGPGSFSLIFAPGGAALVSETGPAGSTNESALSSYSILADGTVSAISKSVPSRGSATCWEAITPNGRYVYTANSASSTISAFRVARDGSISPLSGTVVGTLGANSVDIDMAITSDGEYLYTLNSGDGTVGVFKIREDGTLAHLGDAEGLSPASGFNGLSAY